MHAIRRLIARVAGRLRSRRVEAADALAPRPDADTYRVEVTPGRGRRGGYRVQVYDMPTRAAGRPLLADSGHLPGRTIGLWRATPQGAYHLGVSEAYEIHDGCDLPLVVWHGGVRVIDQREPAAPDDEDQAAEVGTGDVWRTCYGSPGGAR